MTRTAVRTAIQLIVLLYGPVRYVRTGSRTIRSTRFLGHAVILLLYSVTNHIVTIRTTIRVLHLLSPDSPNRAPELWDHSKLTWNQLASLSVEKSWNPATEVKSPTTRQRRVRVTKVNSKEWNRLQIPYPRNSQKTNLSDIFSLKSSSSNFSRRKSISSFTSKRNDH